MRLTTALSTMDHVIAILENARTPSTFAKRLIKARSAAQTLGQLADLEIESLDRQMHTLRTKMADATAAKERAERETMRLRYAAWE